MDRADETDETEMRQAGPAGVYIHPPSNHRTQNRFKFVVWLVHLRVRAALTSPEAQLIEVDWSGFPGLVSQDSPETE